MTPPTLLASLTARGVRLTAVAGRLRVDAPRGVLTPEERANLVSHKADLLALLQAEDEVTPVPLGPCELCSAPLTWVTDWPSAGESRWICTTCAAWPAPSLAEVFQTLTADERQRLEAEARAGDDVAVAVLRELGERA